MQAVFNFDGTQFKLLVKLPVTVLEIKNYIAEKCLVQVDKLQLFEYPQKTRPLNFFTSVSVPHIQSPCGLKSLSNRKIFSDIGENQHRDFVLKMGSERPTWAYFYMYMPCTAGNIEIVKMSFNRMNLIDDVKREVSGLSGVSTSSFRLSLHAVGSPLPENWNLFKCNVTNGTDVYCIPA